MHICRRQTLGRDNTRRSLQVAATMQGSVENFSNWSQSTVSQKCLTTLWGYGVDTLHHQDVMQPTNCAQPSIVKPRNPSKSVVWFTQMWLLSLPRLGSQANKNQVETYFSEKYILWNSKQFRRIWTPMPTKRKVLVWKAVVINTLVHGLRRSQRSQRAQAPQISRISCRFVHREALAQTKYSCSLEGKYLNPPKLWAGYAIVDGTLRKWMSMCVGSSQVCFSAAWSRCDDLQ